MDSFVLLAHPAQTWFWQISSDFQTNHSLYHSAAFPLFHPLSSSAPALSLFPFSRQGERVQSQSSNENTRSPARLRNPFSPSKSKQLRRDTLSWTILVDGCIDIFYLKEKLGVVHNHAPTIARILYQEIVSEIETSQNSDCSVRVRKRERESEWGRNRKIIINIHTTSVKSEGGLDRMPRRQQKQNRK